MTIGPAPLVVGLFVVFGPPQAVMVSRPIVPMTSAARIFVVKDRMVGGFSRFMGNPRKGTDADGGCAETPRPAESQSVPAGCGRVGKAGPVVAFAGPVLTSRLGTDLGACSQWTVGIPGCPMVVRTAMSTGSTSRMHPRLRPGPTAIHGWGRPRRGAVMASRQPDPADGR